MTDITPEQIEAAHDAYWAQRKINPLDKRAAWSAAIAAAEGAAWRPIGEADGGKAYLVGKRGTGYVVQAFYHGAAGWRHMHSLDALCFEPDVFQHLPPAAGAAA